MHAGSADRDVAARGVGVHCGEDGGVLVAVWGGSGGGGSEVADVGGEGEILHFGPVVRIGSKIYRRGLDMKFT